MVPVCSILLLPLLPNILSFSLWYIFYFIIVCTIFPNYLWFTLLFHFFLCSFWVYLMSSFLICWDSILGGGNGLWVHESWESWALLQGLSYSCNNTLKAGFVQMERYSIGAVLSTRSAGFLDRICFSDMHPQKIANPRILLYLLSRRKLIKAVLKLCKTKVRNIS